MRSTCHFCSHASVSGPDCLPRLAPGAHFTDAHDQAGKASRARQGCTAGTQQAGKRARTHKHAQHRRHACGDDGARALAGCRTAAQDTVRPASASTAAGTIPPRHPPAHAHTQCASTSSKAGFGDPLPEPDCVLTPLRSWGLDGSSQPPAHSQPIWGAARDGTFLSLQNSYGVLES